MSVSFGQRLRQRREQRHVSIDAIAAQTKINPTLLRGLERDDLSRWPEGIFRRSYIRAYASAVGLDPDEVAREFLALHPDSIAVLPPSAAVWPEQMGERDAPPAGRRLGRLVSALASVPARLRWSGGGDGSNGFSLTDREPSAYAADHGAADAPTVDDHAAAEDITLDRAPDEGHAAHRDPDLAAFAQLCTRLAQADDADALGPVMADAAAMLHAVGLIVWSAKPCGTVLVPALVHGYPDSVRAWLTAVPADAENAVGLAYRRRETSIVDGDGVSGGVAAPLLGRRRCVGVLALELPPGVERLASIRACVSILAAQLVSAPLSRPRATTPRDVPAAR